MTCDWRRQETSWRVYWFWNSGDLKQRYLLLVLDLKQSVALAIGNACYSLPTACFEALRNGNGRLDGSKLLSHSNLIDVPGGSNHDGGTISNIPTHVFVVASNPQYTRRLLVGEGRTQLWQRIKGCCAIAQDHCLIGSRQDQYLLHAWRLNTCSCSITTRLQSCCEDVLRWIGVCFWW